MKTEEQIVYSIIETVNKSQVNQDNRVGERLVRAYLQKYRADLIAKHSMDGFIVSEECFQNLGELTFYDAIRPVRGPVQFVCEGLPKFITLRNQFGIIFEKNGENVPLLSSEEYNLGLKNIINKKLPKAKIENNKGIVHIGYWDETPCGNKPSNNNLINDFWEQYQNSISNSPGKRHITLNVRAILQDPNDAPGYNWTLDPYPLDAELIDKLTTQILSFEFNIVLQVKPDKVTDGDDE